MNNKRAFAAEQREKKVFDYTQRILKIIADFTANPFDVDYGKEMDKLNKENKADKGLILLAERESYKVVNSRKKKPMGTNQ